MPLHTSYPNTEASEYYSDVVWNPWAVDEKGEAELEQEGPLMTRGPDKWSTREIKGNVGVRLPAMRKQTQVVVVKV